MSAYSHYDNYYNSQSSHTMSCNQQTREDTFVELHEALFTFLFWSLRNLIIVGAASNSLNIASLLMPIYVFAVPRAWKRSAFVSTYFPLAVLAFIPNSFFMTSMIAEDVSMQNLARMLFCLIVPIYVDMYIMAVIEAKQADPKASLLLGLDWVPGYIQDLLKAVVPEHTYVSQGTQTSAEDLGPDPAAAKTPLQQRRNSRLSLTLKTATPKDLCCMPAGKICCRHRPNGPKSRRIRAELGMELTPMSPVKPKTPSPIQQHERPAQMEPVTAEPEAPAEPTTSPVNAPVQERDTTPGPEPIEQGQEVQLIVSPPASPTVRPTETPDLELATSAPRSPEVPTEITPAAVEIFWQKEDRSPPKFDKRQHTRAYKNVACADPFERSGHAAGWRKAGLPQGSGSMIGQWAKGSVMLRAFVKRELAIQRTPLETMMIRSSRCLQRLGVRHARAIGYRADRLVFYIIRASQKGRISRPRKQAQEEEEKEDMVAAVPPIEDSPAAANVVGPDVEEVLTVKEPFLTLSSEAAARSDLEVAAAAAIPLPTTPSPPASESGDAQLAAPEPAPLAPAAPSAPSAPSEDTNMASIELPSSDLGHQQRQQQQEEVQDEVLLDLSPDVDTGTNQQLTITGPPAAAFIDTEAYMNMVIDDQASTEPLMDMAISEDHVTGMDDLGFGPIDQDTAMIEQGPDSMQLEMQSHQQTCFVEDAPDSEQFEDVWPPPGNQVPAAVSQDWTMEEVDNQGAEMAAMGVPVSQPEPMPAPATPLPSAIDISMSIVSWPGQTQAAGDDQRNEMASQPVPVSQPSPAPVPVPAPAPAPTPAMARNSAIVMPVMSWPRQTQAGVDGQRDQKAAMSVPDSHPTPAPARARPLANIMPIISWPGQTQAAVVQDSAPQQKAQRRQVGMAQQAANPAPQTPAGVFNFGQATAPAGTQARSENTAATDTVDASRSQQQGGAQLQESSVFTFSQPAPRHMYQSSPKKDTHPVLKNPALTAFARREGHEVVRPPSIFNPGTLTSPADRALHVLSEAAAATAARSDGYAGAPQTAQGSPQQQAEASGNPSPPNQGEPASTPEADMGEADDSFSSIGEEMNAIHAEWQEEARAKDDVDLTELDRQLLGLISPAPEYAEIPPLLSPLTASTGSKGKSPDSQRSWSSGKSRKQGSDCGDDGDAVPLFAAMPPEVLAFQRRAGMMGEPRDEQGSCGAALPPIQSHHGGGDDVPLFAPMPDDLMALQADTPSKPPRETKKDKAPAATAAAAPPPPARQQDAEPSSSTAAQQTAAAKEPVLSADFAFTPFQAPSMPNFPSFNTTPSGSGTSSSAIGARPRLSQARTGSGATGAAHVAGPIFNIDPLLLDRNTEGAFAPIPAQDSIQADLEAARAAVQENLKQHPNDILGGQRVMSSGSEPEEADEEVMKTRKVMGLTRAGKK